MTRQQEGDEAAVKAVYPRAYKNGFGNIFCDEAHRGNAINIQLGSSWSDAASKIPATVQPEDDPCEWHGRILSQHHEFVDTPDGFHRCINCKKEYQGTIVERTPEETTLPATDVTEEDRRAACVVVDSNLEHASIEHVNAILVCRERQLVAALRDLKTVLDRESATTARFDAKMEAIEAERDALKAELEKSADEYAKAFQANVELHKHLESQLDAVVGQETPQDAFRRGQEVMQQEVVRMLESISSGIPPIVRFAPYTPPLKAGR